MNMKTTKNGITKSRLRDILNESVEDVLNRDSINTNQLKRGG